jgi:hypothetical protein
MTRKGLAHDFAPDLARAFAFEPVAAHMPAIPDALAGAFHGLGSHLRVANAPKPSPVIAQDPPDLKAAWTLAATNLVFAAILIWSATGMTARAGALAVHSTLQSLSHGWPLIGLFGWVYAITLTSLFVWR